MKRNISIIVFWGALWGITEATLGYALHSLSLSIGWLLWFPMAYYFTSTVYRKTGKKAFILATSAIAASIKLIDLMLPTRIDKVINPAVSIILEGLAVYAAFLIIQHKQDFFKGRYLEALSVSMGWRAVYAFYILLMPEFFYNLSPLRAADSFAKFFFLESIANSLIIYAYIKIEERINKRKETAEYSASKVVQISSYEDRGMVFKITASFLMLALAFYIQWVI